MPGAHGLIQGTSEGVVQTARLSMKPLTCRLHSAVESRIPGWGSVESSGFGAEEQTEAAPLGVLVVLYL